MGEASSQVISNRARQAVQARQWPVVEAAARELIHIDVNNSEGWFLLGLAGNAAGRQLESLDAFSRALKLDGSRYDAAIELAWIYWATLRHAEAKDLLERYQGRLAKSSLYSYKAAETWSRLGLHAAALPLYKKACDLQPDVDQFRAGLAACSVLCGELSSARDEFLGLLERHPGHQRHHYELSRLARATDRRHVDQMISVLESKGLPPEKCIFLYYALGKELEDLEAWDESFHYYQLGGNAAASVAREAGYSVQQDIELIERIIHVCDSKWLSRQVAAIDGSKSWGCPIFVTGLPRTGTTLTERILASHSSVESADESFFLEIALRRLSGIGSGPGISPEIIDAAALLNPGSIGEEYLKLIRYRLNGKPFFIEKYPFNFLHLGFVAKGMPEGRIVHLQRNPMDACFAMYKQPYFRFAFTFKDLSAYYQAYDRLMNHWRGLLGERLIELRYEDLVNQQESETRRLLDRLGLEFEPGCLAFEKNTAASASASTVQVREKIHLRSVNRWTYFSRHLQPLKELLVESGIAVE